MNIEAVAVLSPGAIGKPGGFGDWEVTLPGRPLTEATSAPAQVDSGYSVSTCWVTPRVGHFPGISIVQSNCYYTERDSSLVLCLMTLIQAP